MGDLLTTENLKTNFYTFEGVVKALNGVSVTIKPGETYGLVGESGCGKSVTVRSMMRIVQEPGRIEEGRITIFFDEKDKERGVDIVQQSDAYMQQLRGNEISMIFQEAGTSLNPVFSVEDQVGESFEFHRLDEMLEEAVKELDDDIAAGKKGFLGFRVFQRNQLDREYRSHSVYQRAINELDAHIIQLEHDDLKGNADQIAKLNMKRERMRPFSLSTRIIRRIPILRRYRTRVKRVIRRHVIELLRSLGLPNPENVVDRYPHELSGGMQQRIVIAIALACHPTLLIADEPTSNLDVTIQAQILDLIRKLKEESINSVVFITHDLGVVAEICDRVSVMYAGDVAETAAVSDLFAVQYHPYTAGLIASVPKREQTGDLMPIHGTVPNLVAPPTGCRFHPRCPKAMDICSKVKPEMMEKAPNHFVACHLYTNKEKA